MRISKLPTHRTWSSHLASLARHTSALRHAYAVGRPHPAIARDVKLKVRVAHLDGHARREATGHDARLADRDGLIRSVERVEGGAAQRQEDVVGAKGWAVAQAGVARGARMRDAREWRGGWLT